MLLFVNHVIRHRKVGGAFTSSSSPTHTCERDESLCRCSTNVSMPIGPGCINFWPIKLLLQILHTYCPIVLLFQFCTLLRTRKHDLNTRKHKYKIYCTLVYEVLVQYNNKYMIRPYTKSTELLKILDKDHFCTHCMCNNRAAEGHKNYIGLK